MNKQAILLLLRLCVLAPVLARGQEVVKNPGFDDDADGDGLPDHWVTSHERVLWREKVFMGKDYEIVSKPPNYVLATQPIALKPGEQYTLTVRCKGDDGGLMGALIVHGSERATREMPLLWRVEPTSEYEDYVRTFVAPNPVAVLYIYNIAKEKGTVSYDRVSLRPGLPDHLLIGQLSLPEIDRPLEATPLETPHIDWASPLAGGPVKAFITYRAFRCYRQVCELAQRMDLDADVIHTGYTGTENASPTGRRAMKRLQQDYYEIYVVASRVNDLVVDTIRERVEKGAGLVIVEGFGRASRFVAKDALQEAPADHFLRGGVPWERMPEPILGGIQTAELGKGRVVRLHFPLTISRVWGLLPTENSRAAWMSREFEYWEWWESLLARAFLWAARREGNARVAVADTAPGVTRLRIANPPTRAAARVIVRSSREIRFDGTRLRTPPRVVPLAADNTLTVQVPEELPRGPAFADVALLNGEGHVVTWGSYTLATPRTVEIAELAANGETFAPADTVGLTAALDVHTAARVTLEGTLIDAFGRVVARERKQVEFAAGQHEAACALRLRYPLGVHHKAFVRVLVDGREHDSAWLTVLVPEIGPAQAGTDFVAMPWGPGMTHPIIEAYYGERVRELGMNGDFGRSPYLTGERGLLCAGYIGGMGAAFRQTKYTTDGVRTTCLSDPNVLAELAEKARESAAAQRDHGVFATGITDEAFLTSRHKRHEVCFGPHCRARYREWLRERYGSLERLNAQWGTDHASWEDVEGVRTEAIRDRANLAPFVDFRTFMTDVWISACRAITDAYHEGAPEIPVGHTNTFGANPFNGNDYWKLCTATGFGWGQEYSEAIKSSGHKAIFELWRSFVETPEARASRETNAAGRAQPFFNYGWIGYHHTPAAAHYEPWWLALHGSRGVSYYATNSIDASRGVSWSLVYPTLRFTPYSLAVKDALADLRSGCGKVFLEYERERPRVGLLWSHPSMLVSWCESSATEPVPNERDGTDSYGTYFRSALNIRQHLDELQMGATYLAPQQILATDVLEDYPLLVLPFTVAAAPELVATLERYVSDGGVLVGDLRCLRTDAHGTPLPEGGRALERLFGVRRAPDATVTYAAGPVAFETAAHGIDLVGREASVYGREPLTVVDGNPLARHATGEPAVIVTPHGTGLAVYLNFTFPAYDIGLRELLEQVLARAGVRRTVAAENPAGDTPPRCYERNTFRRGPVTVHAFIRDHRRCDDTDPVRFRFGQTAHVYDMRAGLHLGRTDSVETTVPPGATALYACLPYAVTGLAVSAPAAVRTGTNLALDVGVETDGLAAGDHVLHVSLEAPGGQQPWHYTRNVLAANSRLRVAIPLALNDAPGPWTARVRDVLTGTEGTARFTLRAE